VIGAGVKAITIAAVALAAAVLTASGASAADAKRGATLAKTWCVNCHVIARGQAQANSDVPSFTSIARDKKLDAKAIAYFLLNPHPPMPNFNLSRSEANDLAAYIESLKSP
jgi:mono/diheme cytochrome c family protein